MLPLTAKVDKTHSHALPRYVAVTLGSGFLMHATLPTSMAEAGPGTPRTRLRK